MHRNFSIISTVELVHEGCRYDLHGDYDAESLEHDFIENNLSLWWKPRREESSKYKYVFLKFKNLHYLALGGIDEEMPRKEDLRLSFMGYLRPDDKSLRGFLPENMAGHDFHIILRFEGGLALKVYAESVNFGTTSQPH